MYNNIEIRQVLDFKVYNVIKKLGIIYASIKKYSNCLFSYKYKMLLTTNVTKSL